MPFFGTFPPPARPRAVLPSLMLATVMIMIAVLAPEASAVAVPCESPLQPRAQTVTGSVDGVIGVLVFDCDVDVPPPPGPLSSLGFAYPDVIVAGYDSGGTLEWFRNTGAGLGWNKAPNAVIDASAAIDDPRFLEKIATTGATKGAFVMCTSDITLSSPEMCAVYVSDGAGNFARTILSSTLRFISALAVADMNGDGREDVVVLQTASFVPSFSLNFDILVWTDDGAGGYNSATNVLTSATTPALSAGHYLTVAQLDGTGLVDVAWLTSLGPSPGHLAIALSTGTMTFGPATIIESSADFATTSALVSADFDSDGDIDLLVATDSGAFKWYANSGDASAWTPRTITFLVPAYTVKAKDIDGDGDMDLAISSRVTNTVYWVSNRYDGGGAGRTLDEMWGTLRPIDLCNGCTGIAFGDIDTDTDEDLVAAANFVDTASAYFNNPLDPFLYTFVAAGLGEPTQLTNFDFDIDGDTDVLAAITGDNILIIISNDDGLGGAWGAPITIGASIIDPTSALGGDMDLDGDTDAIAASPTDSTIVLAKNHGGTFTAGSWDVVISTAADQVLLVDYDGDGDLDIAGRRTDSAIFTIRNRVVETGTLAFDTPVVVTAAYTDVRFLLHRDLNNDGRPDLIFSDRATSAILWIPNVNGAFPGPALTLWAASSGVGNFILDDLNGNGKLDLVYHRAKPAIPPIYLVLNVGTVEAPSFASQGTLNGATFIPTDQDECAIILSDFNSDGELDIVLEGSFAGVIFYWPAPFFFITPITVANPNANLAFLPSDYNLDSVNDVLTGLSSQIGWVPGMPIFKSAFPIPPKTIVVAVAKCGYTVSCINKALEDAGGCTADTILLPTGTYRGCFSAHLLPVFKSLNIDGQGSTIECGGTGGLFDITEGAVVTISDLTIRGAVPIASDANSVAAIRVTDASSLTLTNVVMEACSSLLPANPAVFQVNAGMGGAILVEQGSSFAASASSFVGNTAGDSGGALAVIGTDSVIALTGVSFTNNVATGSGGGLFVLASGTGTLSVTLDGVTFSGNSANGGPETYGLGSGGGAYFESETGAVVLSVVFSGAASTFDGNSAFAGIGGGVAVVGAGVALSASTPLTLSNNYGVWGGGLAAFLSTTDLPSPASSALLPLAPVVPGASSAFSLSAGGTIASNSALYGGGVAACEFPVTLTGVSASANAADRGGGGVFVCLAAGALPLSDPAVPPAAVAAAATPWVTVSGSSVDVLFGDSTSARYGPVVGSPPLYMRWESGPTSLPVVTRATGFVLDDVADVVSVDVFGQAVWDPAVRLTMAPGSGAPASTVVLSGGDRSRLMTGFSVSFGTVKALAADTSALQVLAATAYPVEVAMVGAPLVAQVTMGLNITTCLLGQGLVSAPGLPLECELCSEGTFSDVVGLAECEACEVGEFNLGKGSFGCSACPNNAFRDVENEDNTTITDNGDVPCVCLPQYYAPGGAPNAACVPCPFGATCPGGRSPAVALPGYYPGADGASFMECPNRDACSGGFPYQCANGYRARLCSECSSGYFKIGERCSKCASTTELVLLLMVIMAFVLVFFLIFLNTRTSLSYKLAAAMIGFNSLQITAIYGRLSLDWGAFAETYFDFISFLNLNFDLASPECSSSSIDVYMLKWWTTMLLPVLFCVPFAVVGAGWVVWIRLKNSRAESHAAGGGDAAEGKAEPLTVGALIDAMQRSYYQLMVLLYLPLTAMAMSYFGCRKEVDGWVLDAAPSRKCYNSAYWAVFPFALIFFFVYCAAIPVGIFMLLRKKHSETGDGDLAAVLFTLRYGFLVGRFKDAFYFFEVFIMLRKFGVVFVTTFFFGPDAKANAAVFALAASLVQLILSKPYLSDFHNILAVTCLTSCLAVLEGGTFRDGKLRAFVVVTAILVNIIAIVAGNIIDLWLIRKSEAEAEDDFYQPDSFRVASDAAMIDDVARATSDQNSMQMDTMLSVNDADTPVAMQTLGSSDGGAGVATSAADFSTVDLHSNAYNSGATSIGMSTLGANDHPSFLASDQFVSTPPPLPPAPTAAATPAPAPARPARPQLPAPPPSRPARPSQSFGAPPGAAAGPPPPAPPSRPARPARPTNIHVVPDDL